MLENQGFRRLLTFYPNVIILPTEDNMSRSLTNAELAVLSLIVERNMHGYEIETVIQDRGMRNWTEIGFSSIYHILRLLEREELIGSHAERAPGKGPSRKVYEASEKGRERYAEEAARALSTSLPAYTLFIQGLAALPALEPAEAAEALASYRRGLAERLEEVRAKSLPGLPFHVAAMFSYSETMIRAESDWVAELEERLREAAARGGEI
jgi:DNA-binding PadR family transcriptional regulator